MIILPTLNLSSAIRLSIRSRQTFCHQVKSWCSTHETKIECFSPGSPADTGLENVSLVDRYPSPLTYRKQAVQRP